MGDIPPHVGSEEYQDLDPQQSSPAQYAQNQHAFASQLDMATPHPPGNSHPGAFNMTNMVNSLPQSGGFRPGGGYTPVSQQQRFVPHTSSSPMMPHMANHYPHQGSMPLANQHYYMPQHPQGQPYYGSPLSPPHHQTRPSIGYYPNQMVMGAQQPNHMAPGYYYHHQGAPNYPSHQQGMPQPMPGGGELYGHGLPTIDPKTLPQSPTFEDQLGRFASDSREIADGKSRAVRGPPRKPKQSGHAIWIGNLPPQTDLMSLVHHVCKEALGLESLFLISKSNCAFANFKDEDTCIAAQQKLHDSKFQSVRLVSRLRKSTVEGVAGVTAPTGPAAAAEALSVQEKTIETEAADAASEPPIIPTNDPQSITDAESSAQKDRFFILKSLTVEDLELSVRTGIWATQSHNEESLNKAFKAVDNVYLVFSANKSGEYFGYARMISAINEDPEAAIEFAPKVQSNNDMDLPKAIQTEATEFAPKGRIIDDSARGTIFWEAEREEPESADDEESDTGSSKAGAVDDGNTKAWGKPFKLEWLSTTRLPFYRTRGLRNPWNSNREVKIARDGTELEPSVGRRLIGLFNRVQSPIPGSLPLGMRPGMMVPGYPAVRPYQG